MEVNYAFRHRSATEAKSNQHGTWGNDTVARLVEVFPSLRLVVETLQDFSESLPWTALFFVDYVEGESVGITLEFIHKAQSLKVVPLVVLLNQPPTLTEVYQHINANVRHQ